MVKVQMFQPPQMSGDLGNTSLLFTFHYSGWLTGTLGVVCYNQSYKAAKKTYILYIAQPYRQIRMVWTFITKWEENKQTRHNTFAFIPRAFGDLVWCDLGVLVSRNCVKKCPKYSFPSGESQNPEPLPNPMKLLIVPTWSTKRHHYISVFPKMMVPQNGRFIMGNPIKIDDFGGTTILGNPHIDDLDRHESTGTFSTFSTLQMLPPPPQKKKKTVNHLGHHGFLILSHKIPQKIQELQNPPKIHHTTPPTKRKHLLVYSRIPSNEKKHPRSQVWSIRCLGHWDVSVFPRRKITTMEASLIPWKGKERFVSPKHGLTEGLISLREGMGRVFLG